jgi:hypothetical protein
VGPSRPALAAGFVLGARLPPTPILAASTAVAKIQFDADRVLSRLDILSAKAEALGQIAAAARCEELIGRSRGLFVDRQQTVTLDLNNLTIEQREQLMKQLEESAFKDDPNGLKEWRAGAPKPPALEEPSVP